MKQAGTTRTNIFEGQRRSLKLPSSTQRSEVQILPPQLESSRSGHRKVAFFVGLAGMSVIDNFQTSNRFLPECSQNAHRFPRMPRSSASSAFHAFGLDGLSGMRDGRNREGFSAERIVAGVFEYWRGLDTDRCPWRIPTHAALGVWYSPRE